MKLFNLVKDASEDGVCYLQEPTGEILAIASGIAVVLPEQNIYFVLDLQTLDNMTFCVPFSWRSLANSKPSLTLPPQANLESLMTGVW